jgi:hypothetical protein
VKRGELLGRAEVGWKSGSMDDPVPWSRGAEKEG